MQEAALSIVIQDGLTPSILLVQRKDVPVWVLPGGGIEPGETPEDAAIRETLEETGLTVGIVQRVATYLPLNRLASRIHLFSCKHVVSTKLQVSMENEEVSAAAFFPINNLPSTLFPVHKSFIEEWFEAKKVPIIRPLVEATYFSLIKLALQHPILVSKYIYACIKRALIRK